MSQASLPSTSTAVSLETIADRAGVSVMTVSRALNGDGRGRDRRPSAAKRAAKIREIAAELGYRRHAAAKAMQAGRFNCIGILRSTEVWRNYLPAGEVQGIEEALADRGTSLMLARLTDEQLNDEQHVPAILRELMVDGLLVDMIAGFPTRLEELISRYRVPAVWMNSKHERDCVHPDDEGGASRITEHLLALGHRRIALWVPAPLEAPREHYSVADRQAGYARAIRAAGLEPRVIRPPTKPAYSDFTSFITPVLQRPDRPTALITYGPPEVLAATRAAARLGLRVPEDLSLITFANDMTVIHSMQITCAELPERRVGALAAEMLMQKIAEPGQPLASVAVPMGWYRGASCAPPPPLS